jgi:hypothetical protein
VAPRPPSNPLVLGGSRLLARLSADRLFVSTAGTHHTHTHTRTHTHTHTHAHSSSSSSRSTAQQSAQQPHGHCMKLSFK